MKSFTAVFVSLIALWNNIPVTARARDIDWGKVQANKIVLFYPGVASWEFLTSDDHRLGGREIKKTKKECRYCHLSRAGELDLKADEIASGTVRMKMSHNPFEPEPIPGKKGTAFANVQAAYDDDFLYIRTEWDSKGTGWQKKTSNGVPDRVSFQVNKSELVFRKYGCFIACHNDLNTMPASPSKKEVVGNPYYRAFGRDDVRLYAFYARDSWSRRKNEAELNKLRKDGGVIDLWSVELLDGAAKPFNGHIFDDRIWDEKPSIESTGSWSNGRYSTVIKVRLKSKDPHGVSMSNGDAVSAGLAIHEDGAAKRRHYVSFPFTIGLGAEADIKAVKVPN